MKTYKLFYVLLVILSFSCSKSDNGQDDDDNNPINNPSVEADYTVVTSQNGVLSANLFNANLEVITTNPQASDFTNVIAPSHTFREGMELSYFRKNADCSGTLSKFNFSTEATEEFTVLDDMLNCDLTVSAVAHNGDMYFISYTIPATMTNPESYAIRVIDATLDDLSFVDVPIEQEPLSLRFSDDRLFILTQDAAENNMNALYVLDTNTNTLIIDFNLDFGVQQILKNTDGNILVSYDALHLVVDKNTMDVVSTVRYLEGVEPEFASSDTHHFDAEGKLYYQRPSGVSDNSAHPSLPTIYDFATNTAFIYVYEQFLTEAQRTLEFEVGDTSTVSYDAKNNLLLIGYTKADDPSKGGLFRLLLSTPQPEFIDNIDLDGVPTDIYVE